MIHLYIGDGKGKTTAAVGMAVRMLGWGGSVLFSQFLKSNDTGEAFSLEQYERLIWLRPNMRNKGFIWHMNEKQLQETGEDIRKGFEQISHTIDEGSFSLVVLDEVLDVVDCGFLPENMLISLLDKATETEFILTGRKASEVLMDKAHYITRMTKMKHPFDQGCNARKGVEF